MIKRKMLIIILWSDLNAEFHESQLVVRGDLIWVKQSNQGEVTQIPDTYRDVLMFTMFITNSFDV